MVTEKMRLSDILTSLDAKEPEEISLFRFLLQCAHAFHKRNHSDLGLTTRKVSGAETLRMYSSDGGIHGTNMDILRFVEELPRHSMRYFHGLVEALDIYQSIHGKPLPISTISPSDESVRELKQIRDLCIQEGLHSIY
jgi:hypothetical protein